MKITGVIAGECPNGDDCDFVYDTDDPEDVLVRGRFMTGPVFDRSGNEVRIPAHEGLLLVKRSVYFGAAG